MPPEIVRPQSTQEPIRLEYATPDLGTRREERPVRPVGWAGTSAFIALIFGLCAAKSAIDGDAHYGGSWRHGLAFLICVSLLSGAIAIVQLRQGMRTAATASSDSKSPRRFACVAIIVVALIADVAAALLLARHEA